jgi:hypothetical protein
MYLWYYPDYKMSIQLIKLYFMLDNMKMEVYLQ